MGLLTIKEVRKRTGFSELKIRSLIKSGRLLAVDTSTGERACWRIREEDLLEFLTPKSKQEPQGKAKAARRQRIDAGVPKVFG